MSKYKTSAFYRDGVPEVAQQWQQEQEAAAHKRQQEQEALAHTRQLDLEAIRRPAPQAAVKVGKKMAQKLKKQQQLAEQQQAQRQLAGKKLARQQLAERQMSELKALLETGGAEGS